MQQGLLSIVTRNGLDGIGEAILRLAALAESVHRADDARLAANGLSLCREDDLEAHGCADRPVAPFTEVGSDHTEVLR